MANTKRFWLPAIILLTLSACGGGGGGPNMPSGDTPAEQIVGTWLSPCNNIHSDTDPVQNTLVTLVFNADNSMKYIAKYYQEDTCDTPVTTGDITREVSATYTVGAETTDSAGNSATDLDILFGEEKINGSTVNPNLSNINTVVFRIEGNKFYSDNLTPESNHIMRYNTTYPHYAYTYQ